MRWTGNVARMGQVRNAYKTFVGKPDGKRPLSRPRRMIFGEQGGAVWTGNIWLRIVTSGGFLRTR